MSAIGELARELKRLRDIERDHVATVATLDTILSKHDQQHINGVELYKDLLDLRWDETVCLPKPTMGSGAP